MAAAYDSYDYPGYWEGREYEHSSEIIAIKNLLDKIPTIGKIVEIGAGFARLTPSYIYRAKKIILVDPSLKLLSTARKRYPDKKVSIVQSSIEKLQNKLRGNSADLIILVRVLHHIKDVDKAFLIVNKLLKNRGYFILEFANKRHWKATISEFIRGNLTFFHDIFPKEVSTKKSLDKSLPFLNYHPDIITEKLKHNGFEVIELRSVSNIRSPKVKKIIPTDILLSIEKILQKPLANVNFGPSMFILAQKKG